jgi:toxin CptA
VTGALAALGLLGAIGALASDLSLPIASALAFAAFLTGTGQAIGEHRRPPRHLTLSMTDARLDDLPLDTLDLRWRGRLAFLRARDTAGHTHRLSWWPDTLEAEGRRALRLAADASGMRG